MDYDEVFSPVAQIEMVRIILAIVAQTHKPVYHFDVQSAFLNGEISEEVYVSQPEGYEISGEEHKVFHLKKALYGLKQAPKAWYSKIDAHFKQHGYMKNDAEHTLYMKEDEEGTYILICLYVDDMVYASASQGLIKQFRREMISTFDMSDLGEIKFFLGLEIYQSSEGIFISQQRNIEELLIQMNVKHCKHVETLT